MYPSFVSSLPTTKSGTWIVNVSTLLPFATAIVPWVVTPVPLEITRIVAEPAPKVLPPSTSNLIPAYFTPSTVISSACVWASVVR